MNIYILGLISKWISVISISVTGLLNSGALLSEEKIVIENENKTKNTITTTVDLEYKTETVYNQKLPKNTKVTKKEGQNGLAYKDNKDNIIKVLKEPETEVVEIGTGDNATYTGKMTGYGANCAGCTGNLSCKTKDGTSWNLNTKGTIYNDDEYGSVRILAAALSKFPCGTIIEVKNPNLGTFNSIVLDTGGAMKTAWENGIVHMDLAFASETSDGIHQSTSSNVEYNVKRWGW